MVLTQQRAQQRAQVIKKGSISYNFHISLQIGSYYNGLSQITFELIQIPKELVLDFSGNQIHQLVINGQKAEVKHEDGFVQLNVHKLNKGLNHVALSYRNKYNNDGSGCVSFTDVDEKQYLYTQFQSYYANRVLALFDQPDLKASMRLNIISPSSWKKILSNEYPTLQKEFNSTQYLANVKSDQKQLLSKYLSSIKQGKMTLFPSSKLLPTYLYCFIAGQYLQLKLQKTYKQIPMSLYCIQSLYKHMQQMAAFVFEITIQSLKFFQSFFGYPYPFNKYDQVFAHQYKWGAMQNAAIVTHNDQYIFQQKVSIETQLEFANTISHQLAHHWFGNLVTMKWWDDLWLNQSFADYISYFCLEKIKNNCKTINYQSAMASFLIRKGWGYHQDMMITTHAIRSPVANTSVADSIFDGITYSKGASTMKQLNFLMKQQNFSAALAQYFHKYQWQNATLNDFIDIMQKHFDLQDFTLSQWRQLWLQNASLNKIQAVWNPDNHQTNAQMTIVQQPYTSKYPILRMHKIKIGLFKENGQIDVIQALIKPEKQTKVHYNASNKYQAVLLNYEDHTFAKNIIDKVSLAYFSKNLNTIKDVLSRTLIWKTFYEMIKDGQMKSSQYADIVRSFIAKQPSDSIFQNTFDYLYTSINTYTPRNLRDQLNQPLFNFIYQLLTNKSLSLQQNRIVILKSQLIKYSSTTKSKHTILSWYNNTQVGLSHLQMTLGLQWKTITKAFTLQDLTRQHKQALFDKQKQIDSSDTAKNKRYLCDALVADKSQFQHIYQQFKTNIQLSIHVKQEMAAGWNHDVHYQLLQQYKNTYFNDITNLSTTLEGDHYEFFYSDLQPIDDDLQNNIAKYQAIKLQGDKMNKHSRNLLKIIDNLQRRLHAYKLYTQ